MGVRGAVSVVFGALCAGCLSLLLGFVFCGGFKLVKLGWYMLSYRDKHDESYSHLNKEFAGTLLDKHMSGFYAGYLGEKVWLWTVRGLQSYEVKNENTTFYLFELCGENKRYLNKKIQPRRMFNPVEWSYFLHFGDYIQIRYYYDLSRKNVNIIDQAGAYDADLWMEDTIERQCQKL